MSYYNKLSRAKIESPPEWKARRIAREKRELARMSLPDPGYPHYPFASPFIVNNPTTISPATITQSQMKQEKNNNEVESPAIHPAQGMIHSLPNIHSPPISFENHTSACDQPIDVAPIFRPSSEKAAKPPHHTKGTHQNPVVFDSDSEVEFVDLTSAPEEEEREQKNSCGGKKEITSDIIHYAHIQKEKKVW